MPSDIALFEPNQRGRRTFDVFLADKARQLDAADFELAQRMGKAFFSLFRYTARHRIAGVWLDDLPRRQPKPLAHGRKPRGVRAHGGRFRHAPVRRRPISMLGLESSYSRMRRQPSSAFTA
jgi:hypothetical protein